MTLSHHLRRLGQRLRGDHRRPRLVFTHVPKCGGTAVDDALRRHYPKHHRAEIAALATRNAAEESGRDLRELRTDVLRYHLHHPSYAYLAGHVPIDRSTLEAHPNWAFVTLLRDPVERWISNYLYNRYKPDRDHFAVNLCLDDFLESERAAHYGRFYLEYFGGRAGTVDSALRCLEAMALVGTLESLENWRAAFADRYGMYLRIAPRNLRPAAASGTRIDTVQRQRIEALCAPDRAVYAALTAR